MTDKTLVIKVGGALLENAACLQAFFAELHTIQTRRPVVVVHGGGALVQKLLTDLGFTSEKKNGLRITPTEHMPYVIGGLAGSANKQMLSAALSNQVKAVGISLADGGDIHCSIPDSDLGNVGEVSSGSAQLIQDLVNADYMPVVSSIGATEKGQLLNVNADQAAEAIAKMLKGQLVLLSDVDGILDGNQQVIDSIDQSAANQLINDGVITDGMIVKVQSAIDTANTLNAPIAILNWRFPNLITEWLDGKTCGTTVQVSK